MGGASVECAITMSRDPTVDGAQGVIDAREIRQNGQRPGPPEGASNKHEGVDATHISAGPGNESHFLVRGMEIVTFRQPAVLQRDELEAAGAEAIAEPLGEARAERTVGVVTDPAAKRFLKFGYKTHINRSFSYY